MFKQRISMGCTKEQYEKHLKDELLKMGYTELESEMSRIIDELWDSIEKSHIDALKSKGYKILKPKTWEEV